MTEDVPQDALLSGVEPAVFLDELPRMRGEGVGVRWDLRATAAFH